MMSECAHFPTINTSVLSHVSPYASEGGVVPSEILLLNQGHVAPSLGIVRTRKRGRPAHPRYVCPACRRSTRLIARTHCAFDPEIEAQLPANMSGKVTLRARGAEHVVAVIVPPT